MPPESLVILIESSNPKHYLGYLRQLVNYASGGRIPLTVAQADLFEIIRERTLEDLVHLAHQAYPPVDHPHLVGLFEEIADQIRVCLGIDVPTSVPTVPDISEASIFVLIARAQIAAGIRGVS